MSSIALIEQALCEVLGMRPRRAARAALERELECVRRERGLDIESVARLVKSDATLVRRLAGAITVEETFFLRHPEHFDALCRHVRVCLEPPASERALVWSVGCSSGEEPYSMAMAIHRTLGASALNGVRILANDVDEVSIARARRAVYGPWSFRGTDPSLKQAYFDPINADQYQLRAVIRAAVSFEHLTIDELLARLSPASVDVAFFRNVAIYLTSDALDRIYVGLARVLREGALLVLGPADPLPPTITLQRVRVERGFVHTRRSAPPSAVPSPLASRSPTLRRSAPPSGASVPSTAPSAASSVLSPRAPPSSSVGRLGLPGARPALLPPPAPPPLEVSGDLESSTHPALALADLGRTDEALSMLDREIARTGQSAASLGLRGRILLATGSSDRGLEDLRAALYLSSSDALLRFHYAHGLAASKRGRAARSQLIEVLRSIENAAEDTPLADGETTVGSLRRAASELLRRVE